MPKTKQTNESNNKNKNPLSHIPRVTSHHISQEFATLREHQSPGKFPKLGVLHEGHQNAKPLGLHICTFKSLNK